MPSIEVTDFSRHLMAREDGAPPLETRQNVIFGFMFGFVPLAFVTLCLRLFSRWKFAKLGWDDLSVTIGFILYLGLVIATVEAMKYGLGLHVWDLSPEKAVQMQKCGFSSQVLYPSSLGAIKLSIVLFLLRTLPPDHSWRKPLYALGAWIVASEGAFTISLFLQCRPLSYYWDKSLEGSCFNQPAFYYVDAALNMATDLVILSIPWFIFRKLNIPKRRKYELLILCSVGVFTLITSVVRLPYLHDLNRSADPTWSVPNIVIWSIAELGSAITLCSIPAIRPLITHVFPHILSVTTRGRGSSGATGGLTFPSDSASKPGRRDLDNSLYSHAELDDVEKKEQSQEFILTPQSPGTWAKTDITAGEKGRRSRAE